MSLHGCLRKYCGIVLCHSALLADVSHSRGCGAAAGVDVLSAEEVMMVAWVSLFDR